MAATAFTIDAARAVPGPDWLQSYRLAAAERLDTVTWPTPSEEIWRYSRINELDLERYQPVPPDQLGPPGDERAPGGGPWAREAGDHAGLLVVRDGRVVRHELDPALEAKGVKVCGLATCGADDQVRDVFGTIAAESADAFTVLHDAFVPGGALIWVPDGVVIERPILVLHWCEGDGEASFPHTFVHAGANSEVTVLERYGSPSVHTAPGTPSPRRGDHLVDAVAEIDARDNAHVRYLSVQEHGPRTWHIGLQRTRLARDATVRGAAVALGGDYARLRAETRLDGEHAESEMVAVYFGDGAQMLDFRTLQDHSASRTRSDLLFKGAVEDHATSVYSGLVRLREEAQKSEAYQTNRNLVLTEGAHAESIPNLEILANDVKCSHGSTVGPIDDEQRYYLESRGIPPEDAERLIVLGFFDDVFARLPLGGLGASLRRTVVDKIEHRRQGK